MHILLKTKALFNNHVLLKNKSIIQSSHIIENKSVISIITVCENSFLGRGCIRLFLCGKGFCGVLCRVWKRVCLCPQSMFEAAVRVRACRFLEAVLLEMRFQIVTVCMKAVFG